MSRSNQRAHLNIQQVKKAESLFAQGVDVKEIAAQLDPLNGGKDPEAVGKYLKATAAHNRAKRTEANAEE